MKCLYFLLIIALVHLCRANGSDPCINAANPDQIIEFRYTEDVSDYLGLDGARNVTDSTGCQILEIESLFFTQNNRPRFFETFFAVTLNGRLFDICGSQSSPLAVSVRPARLNATKLEVNPIDQTAIISPFVVPGDLVLPNNTIVKQFNLVTKNTYIFSPISEPTNAFQSDTIAPYYFQEPTCTSRRRLTGMLRSVSSPLFEFSIEISGGPTYYLSLPAGTKFQSSFQQTKFFYEHCTCRTSSG